jgi:hypothetical protein
MSEFYSTSFNPVAIKHISEAYGFCLIKGFFSHPEMVELEGRMKELSRVPGGESADLYSCPSLRHVMLNGRVLDIARTLLGEQLVYYRETNIAYEDSPGRLTRKPFRELHCDAKGMNDSLMNFWNGGLGEIYPGYRFAIYFRNYRDFSGGLKVGVGTHRNRYQRYFPYSIAAGVQTLPFVKHIIGDAMVEIPIPPFELYNVCSEPGDLVIFNLRTFHSAGAVRFKKRPALAVLPIVEESVLTDQPELASPNPEGCRNAIFFDYGAKSEAIDYYIKWRAIHSPEMRRAISPLNNTKHSDFDIRNDAALFSTGMAISQHLKQFSLEIAPEQKSLLRKAVPQPLIDRFVELGTDYKQYTAKHSFFDVGSFNSKMSTDPDGAVVEAANDIRKFGLEYRRALEQERKRHAGELPE